jgi:hypothetical protein
MNAPVFRNRRDAGRLLARRSIGVIYRPEWDAGEVPETFPFAV